MAMVTVPWRVGGFPTAVPFFLPGVVLSVVLAVALAPTVGRQLATRTAVAFLLLVSVGTIVAATLTPGVEAVASGVPSDGGCDLSRIGLAPLTELARISEASLNVVLFVPLGIAAGLLPRARRSLVVVSGAFLLPIVVEGVQMLAPVLGRACESADIFDNLTGLAIGLVAAGLARAWLGRARRQGS
jgi:glycopeptide antibiotics resistance protein